MSLASLEDVFADRLVILTRKPAQQRSNVLAFRPTLIDGSVVRIHPLARKALGLAVERPSIQRDHEWPAHGLGLELERLPIQRKAWQCEHGTRHRGEPRDITIGPSSIVS